jgi:hypothetical protein
MKLHELLAVENNLETQAAKTRTDLMATFEKKRHLFAEKRVVFIPSEEGKPQVTESQSDIQSTVMRELDWVSTNIQKALDASLRVALTNTTARASIVIEDTNIMIAKDVPATALLELEKRVAELHALVGAIPTLDPALGFVEDPARGAGIYKAREVNKTRSKKDVRIIVKYAATKEHPAQTELLPCETPIGTLQEQEWSSLITPAQKAEMLDRVERLLRATRQARSRANDCEVPQAAIGGTLLRYVFTGKVNE